MSELDPKAYRHTEARLGIASRAAGKTQGLRQRAKATLHNPPRIGRKRTPTVNRRLRALASLFDNARVRHPSWITTPDKDLVSIGLQNNIQLKAFPTVVDRSSRGR